MNLLSTGFFKYREPVFAGEPQIQNHERKRGCSKSDQRGVAVLNPVDGIAFGLETVDDAFTDHFIVFNEKDSHDVFCLKSLGTSGRYDPHAEFERSLAKAVGNFA